MTSERPYRRKLSAAQAAQELTRCIGTQFDPELVDVFLRVMDLQDEADAAGQATSHAVARTAARAAASAASKAAAGTANHIAAAGSSSEGSPATGPLT